MTTMLLPVLGLYFIGMGFLMKKLKRNWFIGIRTPWTVSSDKVWEKTHVLAGNMFKVLGLFIIIGLFFDRYSLWFIIIPVIVSVVWLVVYSYLEYNKEK